VKNLFKITSLQILTTLLVMPPAYGMEWWLSRLGIAGSPSPHAAPTRDFDRELHDAADKKDWSTLRALLDEGANPNISHSLGRSDVTLLTYVARLGDACTISALLKAGANPNPRPSGKVDTFDYPLLWAAKSNSEEAVMALLDGGTDPCAKNGWGYTPLHAAARRQPGNKEDTFADEEAIILELIGRGNIPDETDEHGKTALHQAAWSGNVTAAKTLLTQGANPDAVDSTGQTALGHAVYNAPNAIKVTETLLEYDANPLAGERTALERAWDQLHYSITHRGSDLEERRTIVNALQAAIEYPEQPWQSVRW